MAANQSEGMQPVETKDAPEEISGKKKSKFQAFKKLFIKKKRKESPAPITESKLKPSQSSSDVSVSGANTVAFHSAEDPVTRGNMGNKAVSHDSVFISEMENSTKGDISQENTPGKVKALQLQLQQNIRIGSPPQAILLKKQEDSGALSEDDGLPRSPPEIATLHEILQHSSGKSPNSAQRRSSLSLGGTDSEDEPEPSESSSHCITPLSFFPPLDFSSPPISVTFLDYSAAKHRIAIKPKKRRKPNLDIRQTKVDSRQEAPNEQMKMTEDEVVQEKEVDMTLSTLEMDKSENCNTQEVSETSLHETQVNKADVNLRGILLAIADQVKTTEIKTEREQEDTSPTQPCPEQCEVAFIDKPIEINDAEVDAGHVDASHGTAYNASGNLRDTSVCGIDETTATKVKDEEAMHDIVIMHLSEVQDEVPDISESTFVETESPKDDLKLDPAIMKGHEAEQRVKIAPKIVLLGESIYVESPVTKEVTLSEVIPEASDTWVSDVEVNPPIINEPPPSEKKVETFDIRIIEGSNELSDVNPESAPGIHKTDSLSMSLANVTHDSDSDLLTSGGSSMECKVTKPADSDSDSKTKASNKPVRFTVAPAWQRALSVGSSAKDSSSSKSMAANKIRSESFDSAECKSEPCEVAKDESCVHFGVRLRSTSSSIKYSEEHPEEISKQCPSSVDTASSVAARNVQSPKKTLHVQPDFSKNSKSASFSEDKNQLKPKVEELSPQEIKEPAWITMAKLKQKGFQHHPLAKEQSIKNESDDTEVPTECFKKKNIIVTSPQKAEVKTSEVASNDSPAVSDEMRMEPGRNIRSSQPQNPEEPPWLSLAKKKAKAWSEMPQSVQ